MAGLAGGVGVALLYRALAIGVMAVVAPTTAVCAVAVPVLVAVAMGERLGIFATAGIVLAIVAIALVSQSNHPEPGDMLHERLSAKQWVGVACALIAVVAIVR